MKYLLVIFVSSLTLTVSMAVENCTQKRLDMDKAVQNCLLITSPVIRPFKTADEFNNGYCIHYKGWVKTVNEYKSCLKNFQKTVFGIIVFNMKKNGKIFCDDPKTRASVFNHTACFIPENLPFAKESLNKLTVVVEFVADRPNIDEMIPGLCCGFHRLIVDLEKDFSKLCDRFTKRETGKFLRKIVEANIVDALDLMCGNYGSLQQCQEKAPQILEQINLRMDDNTPVYNHTPFISLLRFIQRMDSKVNVND